MNISVLPVGPFNSSFNYEYGEQLEVGTVVKIPFGSRSLLGIVSDEVNQFSGELKSIDTKYDYVIPNYDFLNWTAQYTLNPRGNILKMILSEKTVFSSSKIDSAEDQIYNQTNAILNEEQICAVDAIIANGKKPFLLEGVTGSGKTEVYLKYLQSILLNGKQVLIMLPEIALTKQLTQRIYMYFGVQPFVWNSDITPAHRRKIWKYVISGRSCIVIGTRSALFLPFSNLGAIVVDEEHDSSYKQEENVIYNARDMAIVYGKLKDIPVILSSATPSLESYVNAHNGKYGYFFIHNRFGGSSLPAIQMIDMTQNSFAGSISPNLINAITNCMKQGEQSLIYVNRRGYAPISLCRKCGEKIACPNCAIWLVYHKANNKLVCHYCGHMQDVPVLCPSCKAEESFIQFGAGVEKIAEELSYKIPNARIVIASSDTMSTSKKIESILHGIINREFDIIVGTQILSKGHHFPRITLVGIVDGDLGLHGADIRASEKTYQIINQVAGRAGRANSKGKILIQSFECNHQFYKALKNNIAHEFIEQEIQFRKQNNLPPFSKFISLIVSGINRDLTKQIAYELRNTCPTNIEIFGPAPAPIFLLRGRVRWRILLKNRSFIGKDICNWLEDVHIPGNIKVQIDVDPISFL